jgi:hypothetical protein
MTYFLSMDTSAKSAQGFIDQLKAVGRRTSHPIFLPPGGFKTLIVRTGNPLGAAVYFWYH